MLKLPIKLFNSISTKFGCKRNSFSRKLQDIFPSKQVFFSKINNCQFFGCVLHNLSFYLRLNIFIDRETKFKNSPQAYAKKQQKSKLL